ncbi:pesticin C-terminus-like muramidase [Dickeya chrysanthemi]|uniref:pesticin C-terminus-like muramidase n=1 Tax=Dickeya chrysanthemi TaxID=556 RepID=UPI001CF473B2|nr:pesticin C-terminus-like muramidase [Dickeya chrysanthemi]MCA7007661.1 pesticin C-terminus-like muramidase [Dickeya chrysanthemi]
MAAPLSRLAGTVPGLLSSASTSLVQAAKGKAVESKPVSTESQASPIEVKPVEVDVKINSIAPTSSSDSSTPTAAAPLSNSATASTPKSIATVTWNPATTINSLQRNAKKKSIGYCARAVVDAIQAGGTKIERAPAAKDLGSKLIAAGFSPIFSMPRPSREYDRSKLIPGDVVVLEGFTKDEKAGIKKNHPFGHAAMYDGSKWISDFTQSGFYPGPDYRAALPGYTIYRMVTTQAQIDAINASQNTEPASRTPLSTPPATVTQATRSSTSAPVSRPTAQTPRSSIPRQNANILQHAQSNHRKNKKAKDKIIRKTYIPTPEEQEFAKENNIDYAFIMASEDLQTGAYVPASGKSSITIAGGVDLGKRTLKSLLNDGVPPSLANKLAPYTSKTPTEGKLLLKSSPLTITIDEARTLSMIYVKQHLKEVGDRFDKDNKKIKFNQLPQKTRTMILDLAYQYGVRLDKNTEKTWGYMKNNQWDKLIEELQNFGDDYSTRRLAEAELIKDDLKNGRLP